jgi:hypothetical protein
LAVQLAGCFMEIPADGFGGFMLDDGGERFCGGLLQ